jgi:hypothetical protein
MIAAGSYCGSEAAYNLPDGLDAVNRARIRAKITVRRKFEKQAKHTPALDSDPCGGLANLRPRLVTTAYLREATLAPRRDRHVGMAGQRTNDTQPQFFNYPSLTSIFISGSGYCLFASARRRDQVGQRLGCPVSHEPYVPVHGRGYWCLFRVATVFFPTSREVRDKLTARLGALLLATSPFHIARSQMIEVDIPLTFLSC